MPPAAANEKEGNDLGALGGGAPQTPAEGTASPLHSPAEELSPLLEIKLRDFLNEKRGFMHARLTRLCGAKAPGFPSSLRFSAGTRWRLEKLGSAERPIAEP